MMESTGNDRQQHMNQQKGHPLNLRLPSYTFIISYDVNYRDSSSVVSLNFPRTNGF